MPWTVPWNLVGVSVSGDVGDLTIYTNRNGKKVAFPKSPPKEPPSVAQQSQREAFRTAQASYTSLTSEEKNNLEEVTRRVSLAMTGQNLWMHAVMMGSAELLRTLTHQTGIPLPSP